MFQRSQRRIDPAPSVFVAPPFYTRDHMAETTEAVIRERHRAKLAPNKEDTH